MVSKKLLIAITLIGILLGIVIVLKGNENLKASSKYLTTVEIYKNNELIWRGSNIITDIGFNFTREQLLNPQTGVSLIYISVSNVSGVCSKTATNIQELAVCGLTRAAGTVTRYNMNQFLVEKTFTLTCDVPNVQVSGLHWVSTAQSDRNLFSCAAFPVVNLVTNDQITIRWNVTMIEG